MLRFIDLLSVPGASPVRQRCDCLLRFAFDPSSDRHDAGLLVPLEVVYFGSVRFF